jgi:hypothetical protein
MQLLKYDAACQAILECKQVDEVKDCRDKALAVQLYARQAKNKELEINAAEIRIRAERRLGGMLIEQPKNNGAAMPNAVVADDRVPPTLSDMGISKDLSARAQSIATISDDDFEQTLAQHRDEQQAVTGRTMERLAKKAHVAQATGNNEWYTPSPIIEAAREVMGSIALDPASSAQANKTVKAEQFFTAADDGQFQDWHGPLWMNPPYAHPLIDEFVQHLADELSRGALNDACVLVNNATETAWGQLLLGVSDAVCFHAGRIRFLNEKGEATGAPLQGQMIVYRGGDPGRFREVFAKFGRVFVG